MGKIIVHNMSTLNDAAALQIVQVYMQAMNDPRTMGAYYATMRNRHGEWIDFDDDYSVYDCSVCGERAPNDIKWNFCPNCGADMRGENND